MGIFKDMSDELDRHTAALHGGTRLTKRFVERAVPFAAGGAWLLELCAHDGGAVVARFAGFGTGEDALRAAVEHYRERSKLHAEALASSEAGREARSAIGVLVGLSGELAATAAAVADVADFAPSPAAEHANVSSALLEVAQKRAGAGLHGQISKLLERATDAELTILHERFGDKPEGLALIVAEEKRRSAAATSPARS